MINGRTTLIAHLGYPTETFKAPLIYNPYFESIGVDAVVMPMGVKAEDYARLLPLLFRLTNLRGALVTMPHKVTTVALVNELSTAAKIAGACNAVLNRADGTLLGDMFDGEGFVRGALRRGRSIAGRAALVAGCGGVGSAIAASLAGAGIARLGLFDVRNAAAQALVRSQIEMANTYLDLASNESDRFQRERLVQWAQRLQQRVTSASSRRGFLDLTEPVDELQARIISLLQR